MRARWKERTRLVAMIVLCGLALSCFASCGSAGYVFGVAGQVRDARGMPVPGAQVTVTTAAPVYDAGDPTAPIRSRRLETDEVGWFAVTYTTHELPNPYVLLVEKQGCTPQKVSSVAPPSQEHTITLDCRGARPY